MTFINSKYQRIHWHIGGMSNNQMPMKVIFVSVIENFAKENKQTFMQPIYIYIWIVGKGEIIPFVDKYM
jgi:hypothetical protein